MMTISLQKIYENLKDDKLIKWIDSTLLNDEDSTDQEIINYFVKNGPMSKVEAEFYVAQRNKALKDKLNFKLKKYKGF